MRFWDISGNFITYVFKEFSRLQGGVIFLYGGVGKVADNEMSARCLRSLSIELMQ